MRTERQLTELEGAVLTEIALRGNDTAYQVRRAFQLSPSVQWRGSAGAVSPAIRRLKAAGYVAADAHPRRAGHTLAVTPAGRRALDAWASTLELATGIGVDPFRLRSGVWDYLSTAKRRALFEKLEKALRADLMALQARSEPDAVDRRQTQLAIALLEARLAWLGAESDEGT
ncbi:PadR family transcriptional regulator [Sphingomonas sp. URHD0057]|uniref:PadR family transcriptional regulator n=1 Tax=Sphingomonas sp. URHD0057 TaxID=1380389 RepID=UPI00048DB086|nr:PadR family transcriptional regulator [Sphingomonas sp. URHD0057]